MKKEYRIYTIPIRNLTDYTKVSDDEFIEAAEQFGSIYTLKGFENDFNDEYINCNDYLRIISVPVYDNLDSNVTVNVNELASTLADAEILKKFPETMIFEDVVEDGVIKYSEEGQTLFNSHYDFYFDKIVEAQIN